MSFVDTFFANLKKNPSRPFVTEVHGARLERTHGGRLAELIAHARGALRAHDIAPGDRVVLLAPNSAKWVAADIAMLAEGAIVVPMYARQAKDELVLMMKDAGASLVVCADEALEQGVKAEWAEAPTVTFEQLFSGDAVSEPPKPRADEDVVTIIYTSGTSGEPKGVMTTAGNVRFMLDTIDRRLTELMGRPGGRDRVFHYLPFCFAGSRFVLWSNLYRENGVMVSTDLGNLPEELKTAQPEWFLNVPALLERVKEGVEKKIAGQGLPVRKLYDAAIEAWRDARKDRATLPQRLLLAAARRTIFAKIKAQIGEELSCLICGSAPLAEETQAWFELLGLPVYQVYGLTETTAIVSMDRPRAAAPGKVGYAIDGVEMKLGDGSELLVRGPNIFSGYWGKDEATEDAFQGGWFRTGDQGRIDTDGRLVIVGRVKNILVPESGHNVAPEPIEQRLLEGVPGVTQAVVIGHGRPYLTAILTGDTPREEAAKAIDAINEGLPHYRRIRSFHLSPEPFSIENGLLTANSKLRRKAIEAHYADAIERLYA
ncbi:MAG: AMP-dependent synthetase/ligase [Sandaracinaceae bacterium]